MRLRAPSVLPLTFVSLALVAAVGCRAEEAPRADETKVQPLATQATPILVDGSSTLDPLNRGIVDLYASELVTDVKLEVSGTGGGFKKFCRKQTHLNGASRPITPAEQKLCAAEGVEYVELPVAFDALAIVVPKDSAFPTSLTTAQLKRLWEPAAQGTVSTWKDIDPKLPAEPIRLFGPGIDNGTFDFFTETIVGQIGQIRADYEANARHGVVATNLATTKGSVGFLGFAHFSKYEDRLRAVPIDDGNADNGVGPIAPARTTVADGTYQPLSRPLFLYVNVRELERKELLAFVEFYLRSARLVAPDAGYTPLPRDLFALARKRLSDRHTGTIFTGGEANVGLTIGELLSAEAVAIGTDKPQ